MVAAEAAGAIHRNAGNEQISAVIQCQRPGHILGLGEAIELPGPEQHSRRGILQSHEIATRESGHFSSDIHIACIVGYDASGLEMRMFAQYLNNPEATHLFTTGDPHLANTRNLGLPDNYRDLTVKNGFYAYLYGAGDPKLGRTLDPTLVDPRAAARYGKSSRAILERGTPGLAQLVAEISDEFDHNAGVLRTIDGGFVRCTSKNAALNYKLQSAGAIVMKVAAILLRNKIREMGWDSLLVGTIHDEGQHDADPKVAKYVGEAATLAIAQAGEFLGFHVPLTGDYKIGANWAECH